MDRRQCHPNDTTKITVFLSFYTGSHKKLRFSPTFTVVFPLVSLFTIMFISVHKCLHASMKFVHPCTNAKFAAKSEGAEMKYRGGQKSAEVGRLKQG